MSEVNVVVPKQEHWVFMPRHMAGSERTGEEEVIGEATLTVLRLQGRHSDPVTECCHFWGNMIISLLSEMGRDANEGQSWLSLQRGKLCQNQKINWSKSSPSNRFITRLYKNIRK